MSNISHDIVDDSCLYPYVDLHSHMQFEEFDVDRENIIQEMQHKNVITISVGTTRTTSQAGLDLAIRYPDTCYVTLGLHPVYADKTQEADIEIFSQMIEECEADVSKKRHIVGIGECGMDFFRVKNNETLENVADENYELQEEIFEKQIQLAKKYNIPLMLHVRDSYQKTLTILSKYFKSTEVEYRGNAHFFVGSIQEAQAFLDLGFSISFTGVITFVPAYEELVRFVPLDRMFAETDSPYVSPKPYRGKRNTPVHVIEIYKKIAEIKKVPLEVVRETLYKNVCKYWLKHRNIDNSTV